MSPPAALVGGRGRWLVLAVAALGLAALVLRWRAGVITSDEFVYLRFPGGDADQRFSLAYYLADQGLPSLVHRALLPLLHAAGGLTALNVLHGTLFVLYVTTVFLLARQLTSPGLAAAAAALCAVHPRVLQYFGEHRSYALFLTTAAWGQVALLRFLEHGSRRDALLTVGLFGLAALDNPLCLVLPVATAVVGMASKAWRQRGVGLDFALASVALTAGLSPIIWAAMQAPRGQASPDATRWMLSMALLVVPLLLPGTRARVRAIATMALVGTALPAMTGALALDAGKVELLALPLVIGVCAAAASRLKQLALPVLLVWAALYATALKLPAEFQELNSPANQAAVRAVDDALHKQAMAGRIQVYWARSFKRTEYTSYLTELDPFTMDELALPGLSGHYQFVRTGYPKDRCGSGQPFLLIVAPFAAPPDCACELTIRTADTWHAYTCR